jgi:hypothetical protein
MADPTAAPSNAHGMVGPNQRRCLVVLMVSFYHSHPFPGGATVGVGLGGETSRQRVATVRRRYRRSLADELKIMPRTKPMATPTPIMAGFLVAAEIADPMAAPNTRPMAIWFPPFLSPEGGEFGGVSMPPSIAEPCGRSAGAGLTVCC